MKKFFSFFFLISLVSISTFAGGVGVGNGKRVFRSPEGFAVTFSDALALKVESETAFRISNAETAPSGKVSSVHFVVTKRVDSQASLAALVAREHPGLRFDGIKLPGAEGLYSERRSPGELHGLYYLLTGNLDLVEVSVDAFAEADGLAMVAPIVHTFTYDVSPPKPIAMRAANAVWPAGSTQKLYFRATDDNAGVAVGNFPTYIADLYGANGKPLRRGVFYGQGQTMDEGDDWYSIEIRVGAFVPPGDYVIGSMELWDRALNVGTLYVNQDGDPTYSYGGTRTEIPLVHVRVTNDGPSDVTPPVFDEFRAAGGDWEAGTKQRVYFRLHDDVSGVDVARLDCLGLRSVRPTFADHYAHSGRCRNGRDEGNGWYSIEVELGEYLPTGDYYMDSFYLYDRAGNQVVLSTDYPYDGFYHLGGPGGPAVPVWKVKVHNGGHADKTPPRLEEIAVDTTTWQVGGTYRLRFRATDDLSGVNVGGHTYGYLFSLADEANRHTIYLDQEIQSDGGDWYHVDVHVSPFLRPQEYFFESLSFSDRAGNGVNVSCDFRKPYQLCRNENGPALKPLRIQVVR
jgi:hypothetical protein